MRSRYTRWMISWLIVVAGVSGLLAQSKSAVSETVPVPAPLIFDGDTLFHIQSRLGGFSPAERARSIAKRMEKISDNPLAQLDSLILQPMEGATDIFSGEVILMAVTDADAAAAGVDREVLAQYYKTLLETALQERIKETSMRSLLLGAVYALLAALAFFLILKFMGRLFRKLYLLLHSWQDTRIPSFKVQKMEVLSSQKITHLLILIARTIRFALVLLLIYIFLPLVFSFFPWTENLAAKLFGYLLSPLKTVFMGILDYLPNLFYIVVILAVARYFVKLVRWIFDQIKAGNITLPGFYVDWSDSTFKIARFLVWAFAAIMIFPYLPGSGSSAFQNVSVFLGILLSLGSASAVANLIAGLVLTYMRPFLIGDRVKIADTVGDVVEKTLLVTRVRTVKNVDITVPNAMVLGSHIINFSSSAKARGLILHTSVTIGYEVPWKQVHALLLAAADKCALILKDPKPFVIQTSLDDFYVSYELNVYSDSAQGMAAIYSELHQYIQDGFNEAGVEIMSPHYSAVRDGSQVTIPQDYLPKGYQAPPFRILPLGERTP